MADKKNKSLLATVSLVLGLFVVVSLYQGVFTGFATYSFDSPGFEIIEEYYESDSLLDFEKENLKSLTVTGEFEGGYLEINLFTSEGVKNLYSAEQNGSFEESCSETCDLSSLNTTKIEVLVNNGTAFLERLDYIEIKQSQGFGVMSSDGGNFSVPRLYFDVDATDEVDQYFNLVENEEYTFYIRSEDAEGTDLEYLLESDDFCELHDGETGEISCLPTHETITGSWDPTDDKQTVNESIIIQAREEVDDDFVTKGTSFRFTLVPVNNQAYFTEETKDDVEDIVIEIDSNEVWTLNLEGKDLEMNYPLNFTVSAVSNGERLTDLEFNQTDDTSGNLFFNTETPGHMPNNIATNANVGLWNVTVNLTDSYGYNESRLPDQINFTLDIDAVNFDPLFITDFENLTSEGIQYGNFSLEVEALDYDENDILDFSVEPSDLNEELEYCQDNSPWSIEKINQFNQTYEDENVTVAEGLINQTLNVDHVICRYIDIRVFDNEGGEDVETLFINITNVNDPPVIHNISQHGSIYEQTAYTNTPFEYQVNASDPDELTYNAAEYANLTYSVNNTDFYINSSSGLINFVLTDENFIGNHSLNITVSDGFKNDSKVIQLTVEENQPPVLDLPKNNTFSQYDGILLIINGTDFQENNMLLNYNSSTDFSNSYYNFTVLSNETDGQRNIQWLLNLTESDLRLSNEQVGYHELNITLFDELGATDNNSTGILNFTIIPENDAPFFVDPSGSHEPHDITISTRSANREYTKQIYARDYDLLHSDENLSFEVLDYGSLEDVSFEMTGYDPSSWENMSLRIAELKFTPTTIGEAFIKIGVFDSGGLNDTQNITFDVEAATEIPEFQEIRPYYDNGTVFDFRNVNEGENSEDITLYYEVDVSFKENCTEAILTPGQLDDFIFDAIVEIDTDTLPNNNVSYTWVLDGVEQEELANVEPGVNSSFEFIVDVANDTTRNLTLYAEDERDGVASWTWFIHLEALPTPVEFCEDSLNNIEVPGTITREDYLSYRRPIQGNFTQRTQRFYNLEDDLNRDGIRYVGQNEPNTLNYSIDFENPCTLVDIDIEGDDITISPKGYTGQCSNVTFVATDQYQWEARSNPIDIIVLTEDFDEDDDDQDDDDTGVTTSPTTMPIPFEEEVDVPKPIRILFPGNTTIYENRTISIPVELENTWDNNLRGITLDASVPTHNVTKSFTRDYFSSLSEGQKASTELLLSDYREGGPYEIIVEVGVVEPEFSDSASILISSLEQTGIGETTQVKVTFARDLLEDNPECQELNYYLDQANELLQNGEFEEASSMVDSVINSCRYLLDDEEPIRRESPGFVQRSLSIGEEFTTQILFWVGVLTLFSITLFVSLGIKQRFFKKN